MTIEEIKNKKKSLEKTITNLLNVFQEETKTTVSNLNIINEVFHNVNGERKVIIDEVVIEIKL